MSYLSSRPQNQVPGAVLDERQQLYLFSPCSPALGCIIHGLTEVLVGRDLCGFSVQPPTWRRKGTRHERLRVYSSLPVFISPVNTWLGISDV